MVKNAAWLAQTQAAAPTGPAFEFMKARAETMRQRLQGAKSTRDRVEELLTSVMQDADVSIDTVAGKLGMGRHTLFRRLRAEGVTFRRVVDELRHKLAVQYLSENKFAVNETAYLLGFSDPAAFSRAYKRWTGHSPRPRNGCS
jgi:AraC-like DNA-binding protein